MQLSNFFEVPYNIQFLAIIFKTSYFCARNTVLKKIVTLYTKRVIVLHMSGIMDLRPHKYKAKCGAS